MPTQSVQGPEGVINFPDSMDKNQIEQAMQKLYPPKGTGLQSPTGSISSAPSRGIGQRMWDTVRNSPIGFATEQSMPRVADALGLHPDLTVNAPEYQATKTGQSGLVSPAQLIDPNQPSTPLGVGKSVVRGALGAAGTLTRPDQAAMMLGGMGPLGGSKLLSTYFGANMLEGGVEGGERSYRLAKQGRLSEAGEEAGGALLDLGMARMVISHATGEPVSIKPPGEDHAAPIQEAAKLEPTKTPEPKAEPAPAPKAATPSPLPGSPEYEQLRARVARLEEPKAKPPAPPEEKPDYLKRKLSLTRTGETYVDRGAYPDNATMAARHMERYKIAMNDVNKLKEAGADPARVDQVKTEAMRALTTWGQYTTRENVDATLATLRTSLEERGSQLAQARDLTNNFLQGKASFYSMKPGADFISRDQYRQVAGKFLPKMPKGFVDTLPKDIQDYISSAKPSDAKEMISRQWGAKFLTDQMLGVMDKHTETSQIAAAIAKGKQIDPSTISKYMVLSKEATKPTPAEVPIEQREFNFARSATQTGVKLYGKGNFKVTEKAGKFRVERLDNQASAKPEVRGTAEEPKASPSAESVPAATGTTGPGEPVRAAKGPEVVLGDTRSKDGSMLASDPSAMASINRDLERRGITPPGENQGRRIEDRAAMPNPVLSEEVKTPAAAPDSPKGLVHDEVFNDLVRGYMKRGMAQGTAETMARNKIEREKGAFNLWNKRAGAVSQTNQVVSSILQRMASPLGTPGPEEQTGRNIMRSVFGERARSIDQLYTKFNDIMQAHEGDSVQDLIRFNNAAERKPGSSFLNARDQATADAFQDIYQNILWPTLQQINPDKFGPGIENYFGRLFKGKNGNLTAQSMVLSKQPFEGGKAFTKSRINEWIDESISHGAEPVTNNPIKMQMLVMNQVVKYISAHKAFEEFKDKDLVKYVKLGGQRDPGWKLIDDSIFKPRIPSKDGLIERGNYYAHPDIAKIFNRWMKPGLRGNAFYDPLRNLADTQNMIQLGFSGFHFTFTSVAGAATSDVALGLQQVFNYGKPLKGAGSILKGLAIAPSSIDTYRLGNMMREEWTVPGTHPWLGKYADLMEDVGGGIGSTSLLSEGQRTAAFKSAFKNGDVVSSLKTGLPALAEFSSKWLMQNYVPNLKMGAFAKMAMEQYDGLLTKGAGPDQIRTEIGRTWDSVDNRFGLLRYDNRFWNKTARDLAQLTVRSVGWNWGTLSELFGGTVDVGRAAITHELSAKAAYVMALPMVVGTMGAMMHYGMTGQAPQKLEDYFYPGPEGAKISLPGYHREAFSVIRSLNQSERQGDNFLNKIHPMVQQMYEMWSNQDYYGTEIRHKGDTPLQQAAELGKYIGIHNLPLPLQAAQQQYDKSAGDWRSTAEHFAAGEAGFFPAPKWVGQTKAEQETFDYAKRQWAIGPRTGAEFTRRQTMYQLRWQMDHGKFDGEALGRALQTGRITVDDAMKLTDESTDHLTPFQREFKSIPLLNQMDILTKYATPEEKAQLYPYVKFDTIPHLLPEEQREVDRQLQQLEK